MKYFYSVGDVKFDNYFKAVMHAHETNSFAQCKLDQPMIDAYCNVDTDNLQHISIEKLQEEKLIYLRENYAKLRLHYSGGLDSNTILDRAEKLGIEFDSIVTETVSIIGDPWVDDEFLPALKRVQHKPQFTKIAPTLDLYKTFEDLDWAEKIVGSNSFTFRPTWSGKFLSEMEPMLSVTGFDKPYIYVSDDKQYYWLLTDINYREHMGFPTCHFFIDHLIPELAVKQAIESVKFIKNNFPDFKGLWVDTKPIKSSTHKLDYLNVIGRTKPLSQDILMHTQGKTPVIYTNTKSKKAQDELVKLGHSEIVENFFNSIQHIKKKYLNIPYALDLQADGSITQVLRFAAVFQIDNNNNITNVDDRVVKL